MINEAENIEVGDLIVLTIKDSGEQKLGIVTVSQPKKPTSLEVKIKWFHSDMPQNSWWDKHTIVNSPGKYKFQVSR